MVATACFHGVEYERSAHRTLHIPRLAERASDAQYDETTDRYPSWRVAGVGDSQVDFRDPGRPEPQAKLVHLWLTTNSLSPCG